MELGSTGVWPRGPGPALSSPAPWAMLGWHQARKLFPRQCPSLSSESGGGRDIQGSPGACSTDRPGATCAAGPSAGTGAVAFRWHLALETWDAAAQAVAVVRVCREARGEMDSATPPPLQCPLILEASEGSLWVSSWEGTSPLHLWRRTLRPRGNQTAGQDHSVIRARGPHS